MGSGGLTVEEWMEKMPRHEFNYWKDKYKREPWGSVAEDRRHADLGIMIHGLINMWSSEKVKFKVKDFLLNKSLEEYEKIHILLYSDNKAPWLNSQQTEEERAVEGQLVFKTLEDRINARTPN